MNRFLFYHTADPVGKITMDEYELRRQFTEFVYKAPFVFVIDTALTDLVKSFFILKDLDYRALDLALIIEKVRPIRDEIFERSENQKRKAG
jgi:hypothetical protein